MFYQIILLYTLLKSISPSSSLCTSYFRLTVSLSYLAYYSCLLLALPSTLFPVTPIFCICNRRNYVRLKSEHGVPLPEIFQCIAIAYVWDQLQAPYCVVEGLMWCGLCLLSSAIYPTSQNLMYFPWSEVCSPLALCDASSLYICTCGSLCLGPFTPSQLIL